MPDFEIEGNPSNIRSKAVLLEQKGQLFYDTGDALAKIDVSGWTGRAADQFREAHDLEPERWVRSGNGFKKAASGLTTYAGELENAQSRAEWARDEYARGQRESQSARTQYDSYLSQMRTYWSGGGTDPAQPFVDWGDPIQQGALTELNAASADLESAAHTCAGAVRAGCADAPAEPKWWESGLRFVGGIFEGAGEAVWDLLTMVPFSPVNMVIDSYKVATGDITPEELMKKYELSAENAWDMATGIYTGLTTDPIGFGKEMGKSLLDWDTWADDPARAIGHLVPDAIVAVATGGTGAVATRGTKLAKNGLDALSDLGRFRHLDDLGSLRRLDGPPPHMHQHNPADGFRNLDDQLKNPSYSAANRDIIGSDYDVLGGRSTPEAARHDFYKDDGTPRWPDNQGRVRGTEEIIGPDQVGPIDRIGGPAGEYFADDGASMSDRALPPDRLNFDRSHWDLDGAHPDVSDGSVRIERSQVAPAFGQDGGGNQYRFIDEAGAPLSQGDLVDRGILTPQGTPGPNFDQALPDGLSARDALTGAGVTHGALSADRAAEDHQNAGTRR